MLSGRFVLIMAQAWLVLGALSLVYASVKLFRQGLDLGMSPSHLYWIIPLAVLAGAGKARFVMRRRMRTNVRRLTESTEKFWPWHVYPYQLIAFITSMVIMMFILKRVFATNGFGLGCLGGVDLGVAVALAVAALEYGNPWAKSPEATHLVK